MPFIFDSRGLPPNTDPLVFGRAFVADLRDVLVKLNRFSDLQQLHGIAGMLLLDGYFRPQDQGFSAEARKRADEYSGDPRPNQPLNLAVYNEIVRLLEAERAGGGGALGNLSPQEFAFVGRYIIDEYMNIESRRVPVPSNGFTTLVHLGVDRYVGGAPLLETLDLPELTGSDGSDVEIEPENIRAVGMVYAAHQLEQSRLFDVVDRITETFMNGMLPVKYDAGGRALDKYYWDSEDLMNQSQRQMQYGRVLGAHGGDVSQEVQPNTELDGLWLRFLSAVSEYSRQQRISDLFSGQQPRALSTTEEYVRKAGRDLAANASLYGWGYTHFAARRLNNHIHRAWEVLRLPEIQRAYGVTNSWQVIERVAATEFGAAPNIVKFRTMAQAGEAIFRIIADHPRAWIASGTPLFEEDPGGSPADRLGLGPLVTAIGALAAAAGPPAGPALLAPVAGPPPPPPVAAVAQPASGATIPFGRARELMSQAEYWLAVNGIKDEQVDRYAEPSETNIAPSIPSFGGNSGYGHTNGNGNGNGGGDIAEQLRQMVASGQAPTLDQLQRLLPINVGA